MLGQPSHFTLGHGDIIIMPFQSQHLTSDVM